MLEDLYIYDEPHSRPDWKDDIENGLWLQLLHPFIAVKNLYLSEEIVRRIWPALQELTEGRTTEVLPVLQNIFFDGHEFLSHRFQERNGKFLAARQVASLPIKVSIWADSVRDKVYY
jgi:hypothetical protein